MQMLGSHWGLFESGWLGDGTVQQSVFMSPPGDSDVSLRVLVKQVKA